MASQDAGPEIPWAWDPAAGQPIRADLLPPPDLGPARPPIRPRYGLALLLLLLTFFTTTTMGAVWQAPGDEADPLSLLGWRTFAALWVDPAALRAGLSFSLPLLFILLCHEMGHYLACRYYKLPATLPYFLPAPIGLGTFGAFIKIKAPIRSKRELFDVGVAGPIAGFVALLPFLVLGVLQATPARETSVHQGEAWLGSNLLINLVFQWLRPDLPTDAPLSVGPFWLAAWVGMLATSLNLLPLAQLDGGHVLYAATGRLQRRLAWPLWAALVGAALVLRSPSWGLWAVIVLVMGLRHPPVWDEETPLSTGRRMLALFALLMLVLCFMPVPIGAPAPD